MCGKLKLNKSMCSLLLQQPENIFHFYGVHSYSLEPVRGNMSAFLLHVVFNNIKGNKKETSSYTFVCQVKLFVVEFELL